MIPSDDGTGAGILIPTILIGKSDGKKLKDFLSNNDKNKTRNAAINADFVLENQADVVEWEFWYTSSSDLALDFLLDF